MNVRISREEQQIQKIDYTDYLDGFQTIHKPLIVRTPNKAKTQATSRPFTANELIKTLRQTSPAHKTDYIEDLIKRKTLLNIQYEALKGQPKFESFLLGLTCEPKAPSFRHEESPTNSQNFKYEQTETNSEYKSLKIYNTFGIRRNRSAIKMRDRLNPENFIKSPLFNQQYHPLNRFPTRTNSVLRIKQPIKGNFNKNKPTKSVKSEGGLKTQLLSSLMKDADSRPIKHSARSNPKDKDIAKFLNEVLHKEEKMIRGIKMIIHR